MTVSRQRRSGVMVPLFAAPSRDSWGIGDIGDVAPLTEWLAGAGQQILQLLPINEMADDQQSPYTALSAMAIDPIYIRIPDLEDWTALGGEAFLDPTNRARLDYVRRASRIDYAEVRRLKRHALQAAFERFYDLDWRRDTLRALALRVFVASEHWWVEDYALFQAIRLREASRPWTDWPDEVRERRPAALAAARQALERDVVFFQYLQWQAALQWQKARQAARENHVALFGDLPFMVDTDSADVWRYQHAFRLDVSVGAPPDAFSDEGQDWGMPLYDWPVFEREDFAWLRERARRNAEMFDGYRIDHLVGFYRTYGRPRNGAARFFTPAREREQVRLGERVLNIFKSSGTEIIAEDLGDVPDYVRRSLAGLGVAGFRVMRWERLWHEPGQPFTDPATYPANSVAVSGTHDTETLAAWWLNAVEEEREMMSAVPTVQQLTHGVGLIGQRPEVVHDVLLEAIFASGSDVVIVPVADVFGWLDRINEPGIVNDENWSFCLPWPVDELEFVPEVRARQTLLRAWAARYDRLPERQNAASA